MRAVEQTRSNATHTRKKTANCKLRSDKTEKKFPRTFWRIDSMRSDRYSNVRYNWNIILLAIDANRVFVVWLKCSQGQFQVYDRRYIFNSNNCRAVFVVVVAAVVLLLLFSFVCRTYVYILNLKERRADQCECRFSVHVCVRTFIWCSRIHFRFHRCSCRRLQQRRLRRRRRQRCCRCLNASKWISI